MRPAWSILPLIFLSLFDDIDTLISKNSSKTLVLLLKWWKAQKAFGALTHKHKFYCRFSFIFPIFYTQIALFYKL